MSNTDKDRAHEWVSLNHPDLDGEAYDHAVAEVAAELALLDKAADGIDAGRPCRPGGYRADGSRQIKAVP